MTLDPATTLPVPSPCIDVCQMHEATGWCAGCLRTLDEIAGWSRFDDASKQAVWRDLETRRGTWRLLQAAGQAPTAARAGTPLHPKGWGPGIPGKDG